MMRVVAYVHPDRVGHPETGVAKHIRSMVLGLSTRPGVALSVMAPRKDWIAGERRISPHPFTHIPRIELPGSRKWLEKAWAVLGMPAADRWCSGTDWVYCPMEAYVPTRRARLAVTVHCLNWFEPELPWHASAGRERARWRMRVGRAFRRDDVLILAVSEFLKGRIVELFGLRPERIAVVGNGVEEAYFQAGEGPPPPPGPQYLLVVGGLSLRKGGDKVLQVADALQARGSALEIWVAGESEPGFAVTEHPRIRYLGYRGVDTGLPALMRGAVGLMFLSRYETFGIPAAEAMAAGTPAVVSNYAGLPEVVGSAGLIVNSERPDEVAEQVIQLADDGALRADLIERGRQRSQFHTWANCVSRLLSALKLGGAGPNLSTT